jgi:hypothetical protein
MIDKNYEHIVFENLSVIDTHLVERLKGQTFPDHSYASLMDTNLDKPLLVELLGKWTRRFSGTTPTWADLALFRSLNMANEAAKIPTSTAASFYDVGRSLSLWVSALEILAHPGGTGKSSPQLVLKFFRSLKWVKPDATHATHRKLSKCANMLCDEVYSLRNAFLHGNQVSPRELLFKDTERPMIDYAACLYRLALTSFLSLTEPALPTSIEGQTDFITYLGSDLAQYRRSQDRFEDALLTAVAT